MLGSVKKCAKCDKLVYPVEELKCLDKVWHKLCFKCTTCGMSLNMKNYKGFEKQPYCATHYPQQKYTAVADNPEIQRIKENTKIQSNVKYHDEYEKTKDKYTPIADNLEITRAIENQKIVSGVEYKGSLTKNKDSLLSNPSLNIPNKIIGDRSSIHTMTVTYKAGEKLNESTQPTRKIGSIADYDPLSSETRFPNKTNKETSSSTNDFSKVLLQNIADKNNIKSTNENIPASNTPKTTIYKAIYDLDANEEDEISFRDGDRFLECQMVDVGWMVGVHEKTGKYGFFPSNYVEPVETL